MRWLFYKITCWIPRLVLTPFVKVKVMHRERANVEGACILASNHISHFDPPCISGYIGPKIDWMAMAELFESRILGTWLKFAGTFPVERDKPDRKAVKTALTRLKMGRMLGLFPEGGIRDGDTSILGGAAMKPGLGMLAQLSAASVLPCVILGSDHLYAKRAWRKIRGTTVYVAFGELLRCNGDGKDARTDLENRLAESLRKLSRDLVTEFDLPADFLPRKAEERLNA